MKRTQKSFNTEQSIIREIDAVNAKRLEDLQEAEINEAESVQFIRSGNPENVQHGHWLRRKADEARKRSVRADSKLNQLKNALAEFRTETMPGIIPDKFDRQVVLKSL